MNPLEWTNKFQEILYTPPYNTDSFHLSIAEAFVKQSEVNGITLDYINNNLIQLKDTTRLKKFQLKRFEEKNNVFINVHSTTDGLQSFFPAYTSERKDNNALVINILHSITHNAYTHFHLIKNLERFFSLKNIRETNTTKKATICPRCYHRSYSLRATYNHNKMCNLSYASEIQLSEDLIKFSSYKKTSKAPLVGTLDFESRNVDTTCSNCHKSQDCLCDKNTKKLKQQLPICYSLYLFNTIENTIVFHKTYMGNDAAEDLIQTVYLLKEPMAKILNRYLPLEMSAEDLASANQTQQCEVCEGIINEGEGVLDHEHITGSFRAKCHNKCNLLRRKDHQVIFYCHNFVGYDGHFLMRALKVLPKKVKINLLSTNSQRTREIKLDNMIIFRDSLEFLSGSLDKLVGLLRDENHTFPIMKCHPKIKENPQLLELATRKGIYPYGWVTSIAQLNDAKSFPSREDFFNDLNDEECSEDDYNFGLRVWNEFNITSMAQFTELYCQFDTMLLAEIMLAFRDSMYENFKLDPVKYLSLPSYSFDLMLKKTQIEIEPIPDVDMYNFIKAGIRGGKGNKILLFRSFFCKYALCKYI